MEASEETPFTPEELAAIARGRAALCAFLNVHFTTLPDEAFVQHLRSEEFTQALVAMASADNDPEIAKGAVLMRDFLAAQRTATPAELSQTLGIDRTKLYRGVSPSYGPPPPNEVVWDKRVTDEIPALKALADVYFAAGVGISAEARERLDYIAVQLDFLRVLAVREMEAWQAAQPEQAKLALKQQSSFVTEHIGMWVPAFVEKALSMAQTDFYRGHLTMLRGFLAAEQPQLEALVEDTGEAKQ